jgi:dienelactone hydrolase
MFQKSRMLASIASAALAFLSGVGHCQDIRPLMATRLQGQAPVKFDSQPKEEFGALTGISNTVFKPPGPGPFPAVVVVYTCGGVHQMPMRDHGRDLFAAGYVVLMQDSHSSRGITTCRQRPILSTVGALDAYAGLAHLSAQPYVDKSRIFLAGYSWGAFVAQLASSPQSAQALGSPLRFRAAVANYGNCESGTFPRLVRDVDRPLLMLMGSADTETPPASCFPLLDELKASGVPVQWHVYPGATHAWDRQGAASSGYIYDAEATRDAKRRMLEFFEAQK